MVGHLRHIEESLATRVAAGLALGRMPAAPKAAMPVREMDCSPALQTIGKMKDTLKGRAVGILIADGSDGAIIGNIEKAAGDAGASVKIIAPKVGGAKPADGSMLAADGQLAGTLSGNRSRRAGFRRCTSLSLSVRSGTDRTVVGIAIGIGKTEVADHRLRLRQRPRRGPENETRGNRRGDENAERPTRNAERPPVWRLAAVSAWRLDRAAVNGYHDAACDAVVIGGGINGALVAFHLAEAAIKTVVIDKRDIGAGSTSVSTALLQWEVDVLLR